MKERVIYKERKNTNCEKWDGLLEEYGRRDLLPVWVADMDFEAPSCVQVALQKYIDLMFMAIIMYQIHFMIQLFLGKKIIKGIE